jgi:putative membrane protein
MGGSSNGPRFSRFLEPRGNLHARPHVLVIVDPSRIQVRRYRMRQKFIFAVITMILLSSTSSGWSADKADQAFLTEAMQGNLAEVQMGKLAEEKGQSDGVKSFGQMLATDHADANNKATDVAKQIGVTPPTAPNKMQTAMYDKLSKLLGDAFDRAFTKEMVEDHTKDIQKYQRAGRNKNGPVADYANQTLPTLQKHLKTAQSLAGSKSSAR